MVDSLSTLCCESTNNDRLDFYDNHDYYALSTFIDYKYIKYFKYKGYQEYLNYYKYLCIDNPTHNNNWFLHLEENRALIKNYKSNPEKLWGLLKFVVIVNAMKKVGNLELEIKEFITPIFERFNKYLPLPKDNELLLSDQRKFYLIEAYFNNEINDLNEIYRRFLNAL